MEEEEDGGRRVLGGCGYAFEGCGVDDTGGFCTRAPASAVAREKGTCGPAPAFEDVEGGGRLAEEARGRGDDDDDGARGVVRGDGCCGRRDGCGGCGVALFAADAEEGGGRAGGGRPRGVLCVDRGVFPSRSVAWLHLPSLILSACDTAFMFNEGTASGGGGALSVATPTGADVAVDGA